MAEKWSTLGVKVTQDQKDIIKSCALQNGMTTSEYIKAKLFVDVDYIKIPATPAEKWIIKALSCILVNNSEITERILGKSEALNSKIEEKIEKLMENSHFLNDDDIDNNFGF